VSPTHARESASAPDTRRDRQATRPLVAADRAMRTRAARVAVRSPCSDRSGSSPVPNHLAGSVGASSRKAGFWASRSLSATRASSCLPSCPYAAANTKDPRPDTPWPGRRRRPVPRETRTLRAYARECARTRSTAATYCQRGVIRREARVSSARCAALPSSATCATDPNPVEARARSPHSSRSLARDATRYPA